MSKTARNIIVIVFIIVAILLFSVAFLGGCTTNARANVIAVQRTGIEMLNFGTIVKSQADEPEAAESTALLEVKLNSETDKEKLEEKVAKLMNSFDAAEPYALPSWGGQIRDDLEDMKIESGYRQMVTGSKGNEVEVHVVFATDEDGNPYAFYLG